jgi:predicted NBD/HSP70 family sugar kinase
MSAEQSVPTRADATAARAAPAPGSTASLRAANQRRVLGLLQSHAGHLEVSQAEISRSTRLAPATVSNIVRDLVAAGLVETTTGRGRRGTAVRVSRSAGLVAGVDIGHRHARVAVGDLTGQVLAQRREPLASDHTHADGLDLVSRLLAGVVGDVGAAHSDVLTVGLGLPAPINVDDVVMSSAILPGWVGVNAQQEATRRLGLPTHIDNDANLGAIAEHHRGAGTDHPNMAFVKVSSGVGAGLVIGGGLFRGAFGTAGEIGHLTLDEQGPLCRCGSRGCLEAYASVGTAESLVTHQSRDADLDDVVAAALAGNVAALRILEDAGLHLGWGLAMLANLLNPSLIVVGGDMARAGDLLLDHVRVGLRRHSLPAVAARTTVTLAALGDRASVIGALLLAVERTELIPAAGVG